MKRLLLCLVLLGLLSAPARAGTSGPPPDAPTAGLSATSAGRLDWQLSKMIFADWGGEEYDNSYPPVRWPRAMRTPGTELTVTINSDEMPESVELRMWKELRRNGIPRGKRHYLQCYPTLVAAPGECTIEPNLAGSQTAWNVAFQPPWRGRFYLAISAMWPDGQVAWINHALLK